MLSVTPNGSGPIEASVHRQVPTESPSPQSDPGVSSARIRPFGRRLWDRVVCDFPLAGKLPFWSNFRVIWLVVAAALGIGMLDLPYGLYTIVRLVGALGCGLAALLSFGGGKSAFAWIPLALGCLLYQPLIRVRMDREFWVAADGFGCLMFFTFAVLWAYPSTVIEDTAKDRRRPSDPLSSSEVGAAGPTRGDELLASSIAPNPNTAIQPPLAASAESSGRHAESLAAASTSEPTVAEQLRAAMDKLAADRDRAYREAYREWRENST